MLKPGLKLVIIKDEDIKVGDGRNLVASWLRDLFNKDDKQGITSKEKKKNVANTIQSKNITSSNSNPH